MANLIALAKPHSQLGLWVNADNITYITERGDGMSNIHFVGGGEPVVANVKADHIATLAERADAKRS